MNTGWVLPLCWILTIIFMPIQLIIEPTYISEHTWEFVGSIAFIIVLAPFMWEIFFPNKANRYTPPAPKPATETIDNFVNDFKQGKYDDKVDEAARTIKKVGENVAKIQVEKLTKAHPELKKGIETLRQFASKHKS